jgi:hypothetical protein
VLHPEALEVDVAARVTERHHRIAVADTRLLGRAIAVLRVEDGVALGLAPHLAGRVEDVLDAIALPVVAPAPLVLGSVIDNS